MVIIVNSDSMDPPAAFSYLGLTVAYNKIDWADLYHNCKKDQRWWVMLLKVITKSGTAMMAQAMMYKVVVYMVLL